MKLSCVWLQNKEAKQLAINASKRKLLAQIAKEVSKVEMDTQRPKQTLEEQRERKRQREREKYANMTLEQRQAKIQATTNRRRERHANMSHEQVENHRQAETSLQQERNSRMNSEEQEAHRQAEALRQRERYTKRARLSNRNVPAIRNPGRDSNIRPDEHFLGLMNDVCPKCKALHFSAERRKVSKNFGTLCCNDGKVMLPPLVPYPDPLKGWLCNNDNDSKHFKNNIRKYNGAFAFATFGYTSQRFNGGPQTFAIHGQTYHLTSASATPGENGAQFSQLYFLDPEFATDLRLRNPHNKECSIRFMAEVETLLRRVNPFAEAHKMMKEVMAAHPSQTIEMCIIKDRTKDLRRYNLPIANEVAAVFTSEDGQPPFERDISVYPRNPQSTTKMRIESPNLDPMVYPLLFPHGEFGWQPNLPSLGSTTKKVTYLEFYNFRLHERNEFNPILHAGKLTQQYIVDAYMKVEGNRLKWYRNHQTDLRVEMYSGLLDYVHNQAEKQHLKAGKVFILPTSFTGSKRAMQQSYQDAMVLVAAHGKPDLFITFTCNPNWKEIKDSLQPGETSIDRPDVVATVFNYKLEEFVKDLTINHVLGYVKAYLGVIEFQKRGLPHCHMLFILSEEDKLREPDDVDKVVCAEIPDKDEDPVLFYIISKSMMHGPCGENNPTAPCMDEIEGKRSCTKRFPKSFSTKTNMDFHGYPDYMRRNSGITVQKGDVKLDNRWVVPYNPWLSRKYNAHVNVEVCSSVKSVKYIFKYIYKGHDAAVIKVNESGTGDSLDWDEIKNYIDTRYIAAPEAMWRLRQYDMQFKSHTVVRLAVHLQDCFAVPFKNGEEDKALKKAEERGTTLTNWFRLNQECPEARQYLYTEIPLHYRYTDNRWIKRAQNNIDKILPRMYSVSPKDSERFALRLLLLHIRGATSFNDLKKKHPDIDGQCHDSFKAAAIALNLLDDDASWINTLDEACVFQMPSQLRMLFATILIFGEPLDPKSLYQKYKEHLMEDFLQHYDEEESENKTLEDIEQHLSQGRKTCADFGLPSPDPERFVSNNITDNQENPDQLEADRLISLLNDEQKVAFDSILDSVYGRNQQKCFFLSGAGGSGKTFLYKALIAKIRATGDEVKAVAPTGLASTLLPNGQTVHSGFELPINVDENTVSYTKQGSDAWKRLLKTKLIIWDEISMCSRAIFEAVDRSLKDLLNSYLPFGGITIVVGGDFRQQAPVVLHGNRVKVVEACVKTSKLWKRFEELKLIRNMRVNADEVEFVDWLLKIGSGQDAFGQCMDFLELPEDILSTDIVKSVFGENVNDLSKEDLASRAILSPKNDATTVINECILGKLHGEQKTFYSIDSISNVDSEEERQLYPIEFLNSLTPMGLPPHKLNLKVGCCVMLLRNINSKQGLCNGTRLIVEDIRPNLIYCSIFSGARKGSRVFIPRMFMDTQGSELGFEMRRKQFPLRLAYSMTITKAQGQTFDKIGVYLPQPVFTHGQIYTSFSRVKSKKGLSVQIFEGQSQGRIYEHNDSNYTYNCVYSELL